MWEWHCIFKNTAAGPRVLRVLRKREREREDGISFTCFVHPSQLLLLLLRGLTRSDCATTSSAVCLFRLLVQRRRIRRRICRRWRDCLRRRLAFVHCVFPIEIPRHDPGLRWSSACNFLEGDPIGVLRTLVKSLDTLCDGWAPV